jgi:hypothetical protein
MLTKITTTTWWFSCDLVIFRCFVPLPSAVSAHAPALILSIADANVSISSIVV